MNDVDRLIAIEDIKKLKARYFRGIDFKDLGLLREVFADDVVVDVVGASSDPTTGFNPVGAATEKILHGKAEVMAAFEPSLQTMVSVHYGHMPEIEIVDDATASGVWPMCDLLRFNEGPVKALNGFGHDHETYRRVDGKWRIAAMRLTRLRVDVEMRQAPV